MGMTAAQLDLLRKPLDPAFVKTREQDGRTYEYVEGWKAIETANAIFGFDGWTRETVEMREVRPPAEVTSARGKTTWRVGFLARVRITAGGVVREGTGYGSGAMSDLGEAYESAVKEAETDAMKRALITFGAPFGLTLYSGKKRPKHPPSKHDPKPESNPFDESGEEHMLRLIRGARNPASLEELWATPLMQKTINLSEGVYDRLFEEYVLRHFAVAPDMPALKAIWATMPVQSLIKKGGDAAARVKAAKDKRVAEMPPMQGAK